jgi:hypothetical protein
MRRTLAKWRQERPALFWCMVAAMASLCLNGSFVLANWYAVSPIGYGGVGILWLCTPALFLLLGAMVAAPAALLALSVKRVRRAALTAALASALYLALGIPCIRIVPGVRMLGFRRQAQRGNVLVRAVERYTERHGRPPPALGALAPEFLPSVPPTGMPAYPKWRYVVGEQARTWDDNPWVLYMDCSSGGINFDRFVYFPKQNYPEEGYGGQIERIQNWAYVHE